MFLFLIAVYTTFGLTVHNLPVIPELEFTGLDLPQTAVSADFLSDKAEALPYLPVKTLDGTSEGNNDHKNAIKNQVAFARGMKQKVFFRPKEVKDFYRQQALVEEVDYSFFINCAVLAMVVLWAWRERRNISNHTLPRQDDDANVC